MQGGGGGEGHFQRVLSLHPLGMMGWDLLIQRAQKSDGGIGVGGPEKR